MNWHGLLSCPTARLINMRMTYYQKLQYKNGMSFAELFPVYNLAKQFTSLVSERIDFDIRIRLLNSIGAFGTYFHDGEAAQRYLERSIHEIEKNGIRRKN